jgi:hypothetical protein
MAELLRMPFGTFSYRELVRFGDYTSGDPKEQASALGDGISPVLILYHFHSDPPKCSKLLCGIVAQRLAPDPSFDGSQQRRS